MAGRKKVLAMVHVGERSLEPAAHMRQSTKLGSTTVLTAVFGSRWLAPRFEEAEVEDGGGGTLRKLLGWRSDSEDQVCINECNVSQTSLGGLRLTTERHGTASGIQGCSTLTEADHMGLSRSHVSGSTLRFHSLARTGRGVFLPDLTRTLPTIPGSPCHTKAFVQNVFKQHVCLSQTAKRKNAKPLLPNSQHVACGMSMPARLQVNLSHLLLPSSPPSSFLHPPSPFPSPPVPSSPLSFPFPFLPPPPPAPPTAARTTTLRPRRRRLMPWQTSISLACSARQPQGLAAASGEMLKSLQKVAVLGGLGVLTPPMGQLMERGVLATLRLSCPSGFSVVMPSMEARDWLCSRPRHGPCVLGDGLLEAPLHLADAPQEVPELAGLPQLEWIHKHQRERTNVGSRAHTHIGMTRDSIHSPRARL